jgi:hypothetical protein
VGGGRAGRTGRAEAEREIPRAFEAGGVQNRRVNITWSEPLKHIREPGHGQVLAIQQPPQKKSEAPPAWKGRQVCSEVKPPPPVRRCIQQKWRVTTGIEIEDAGRKSHRTCLQCGLQ